MENNFVLLKRLVDSYRQLVDENTTEIEQTQTLAVLLQHSRFKQLADWVNFDVINTQVCPKCGTASQTIALEDIPSDFSELESKCTCRSGYPMGTCEVHGW